MPMDHRHMSTGSLNILPPQSVNGGLSVKHSGATSWATATMTRFDAPRSPPGRQNTSHVPCKFFRAGACQAGNSCPFSHDPASTTDNICKYFAKGNCRFGPKCANIHVLPDGRRVNYTKSISSTGGGSSGGGAGGGTGSSAGTGNLNLGGQINMEHYLSSKSGPTPINSFLCAYTRPTSPKGHANFYGIREDNYPTRRKDSVDVAIPSSDMGYASVPANQVDEVLRRYGLGSSWPGKVVNIADAPIPASIDNNGVHWVGRHSSLASSIPFSTGIDSRPETTIGNRDTRSSDTLKNLHNSVFGDEPWERFTDHVVPAQTNISEEYIGLRPRHAPPRSNKIKPVSVNVSKATDKDWETSFTFEEDYLPETLKDLMTPQEKARRGSRNADEDSRFFPNGNGVANNETTSKINSPSNASPSRWGSFFQRQQQKDEEDRSRVSPFNHVASPLRKISLHPVASPKAGPIARPSTNNDTSSNSPPRRSSTSIISQQIHRTRISENESNTNELLSLASLNIDTNPKLTKGSRQINLNCASNGGNCCARIATPINEENCDTLYELGGGHTLDKTQTTSGWHNFESKNENFRPGVNVGTVNGIFSK